MDYPFDVVTEEALKWVNKGAQVYQKFTCAGCGSRQTIDEPNKFYTRGKCEECKHVTDIKASGCNYMLEVK